MKRAAITLVAAIWLMAGASVPAKAQQANHPTASSLVSKALAASDIAAEDAPTFRLEARIHAMFGHGRSEDGKLLRIRTPAGWVHEELTLSSYQRIQISAEKQLWIKSTMDYLPFPIFLTERALNFLGLLHHVRGQQLSSPRTSMTTGETCVKTTNASTSMQYCFDPVTGSLTSVADGQWNVTFRYSQYEPFGAKSFPRLMEVVRDDETVFIEIQVDQLAKEENPDPGLFLPVKGAKRQPTEAGCGTIIQAKLDKMVQPVYPRRAARERLIGLVELYADIGPDGVPRGLWPINFPAPVLTQPAVNAVRQWRYKPRTCKGDGRKLHQFQAITILFGAR